jgi:hypothetical protein
VSCFPGRIARNGGLTLTDTTGKQDSIEGAVQRTLEHVRQRAGQMPPTDLMLLDFLQRRFRLDPRFAFQMAFYRTPTAEESAAVALYRRLIDPKAPAPRLPDRAPDFVRTDLMALYGPQGLLPEDFLARLKTQMESGGYALTHAALALQWACEQGCVEASPDVAELRTALIEGLCRVAQEQRFVTDLGLEAIAFLHYLGAGPRVLAAWVEAILDAQQPDGRFTGRAPASGEVYNDHATLLSLWILLEAQHPGQPHTPMMVDAPGAE